MTTLAEDLRELRRLKDAAEETGREKKATDANFKRWQAQCLERMEAEESDAFRTGDYLYSVVTRVKGQIEDRKPYVRWALENDEAIQEFINENIRWACGFADAPDGYEALIDEMTEAFYDAIMGTSTVSYKEDGHVINQQARSHVDDGAPLPPGLTFRPDPYIGMTKS
jgi:hypothetical protein